MQDIADRLFAVREDYSVIYRDGKGGFRIRYILPDGCTKVASEKWWHLRRCCTLRLCNCEPLKRKHLTYRHCRVRRVAEGTHPADFPIDLQFYTVDKSSCRSHPRVKDWLIKRLKSLIEWLGD